MRWVVDYSWKTGDSMSGTSGGASDVVRADTAEEAVRLVVSRASSVDLGQAVYASPVGERKRFAVIKNEWIVKPTS